jgi:hypothetical protein
MATAAAQPERVPLTRAEYEALVRRGAFEAARVELLNLVERVVEVHRAPGPAGYASAVAHGPDDAITFAVAFGDLVIRVADVLPPARP